MKRAKNQLLLIKLIALENWPLSFVIQNANIWDHCHNELVKKRLILFNFAISTSSSYLSGTLSCTTTVPRWERIATENPIWQEKYYKVTSLFSCSVHVKSCDRQSCFFAAAWFGRYQESVVNIVFGLRNKAEKQVMHKLWNLSGGGERRSGWIKEASYH